ncbi:DNA polymerase III subunit epsilon [Halothiobacillus sp. DCM-1]|uniref:DNA polymerase III subunit epsilon n=1 Tax=Halothiobacillus sp. DCM-1 TaxID=3112558 RepID=UPI00324FBE9F
MRQIVLDTETTGMPVAEGHRIIEIGAVELINRRPTGVTFHHYLNPERLIDAGATAVHGITDDDVRDQPRFADIVDEFTAFIEGVEVIAHNAAFDVEFLDAELARIPGTRPMAEIAAQITDSLAIARVKHPGQRNSLDALCRRYDIDNSARTKHGALLDAEILADVYLVMTGGQRVLAFDSSQHGAHLPGAEIRRLPPRSHRLMVIGPDESARAAHEEWLKRLGKEGQPAAWPV